MAKKYISWRRVSTFKQGRSGLGLSAQKEIIRYFIERKIYDIHLINIALYDYGQEILE